MFTRSKHIAPGAIALLAAILSAAALGIAQPLSDQVSTVVDPVGDATHNAPAFQDVVFGQMTKTANGDFELLMEMAGTVPVAPPLPPPARAEIWWIWVFDLDPTTAPRGYPFLCNESPAEFLVYVSWDGTEFAGTAIDRRPLLTGGEAIITSVPFHIDGTIVEADLAYTLIGDVPPSFVWSPRTLDWSGPVGSGGFNIVDVALTVFGP